MNFKSLSLGIIDLLGVVIPGAIWVFIVFYLHVLYPDVLKEDYQRLSTQLALCFPDNTFWVNAFIFFFASYVVGYISRLIPPIWLDWFTLPIATIGTEVGFSNSWRKDKKGKRHFKNKVRPFDFRYEYQVHKLVSLIRGVEDFSGESESFHPIFICKRFILEHSPPLWIEAERREAEIRLVNGLFYAAVALTVIFLWRSHVPVGVFFLMVTIFLAFMFRRRRYAEVSFLYGATFVVVKKLQGK